MRASPRDTLIKPIYRLYSCSLPGTFSNGTLGTGFCEFCRPDNHPGKTDGQTDTEGEMGQTQLCSPQLEQQGFSSYYLGGRPLQVKDRSYYYRCDGAELPCSSLAGFTR